MTKQNCRYWAPNNPHGLHQSPLHSAKVTVGCTVSSYGIIGPYFFDNAEGRTVTVNTDRHKVVPETFLRNELHTLQQDLPWFQQGGVTAYRAQISMQALRTMFPGRIVSRSGDITWPTVPDYFLWVKVKR